MNIVFLKNVLLDGSRYVVGDEIDVDGKEKPMVPEKACLLASPAAKTMLAYGVVSLAGDDEVKFYEGARIPDSWVQRANPSGRVVQIKSRPSNSRSR